MHVCHPSESHSYYHHGCALSSCTKGISQTSKSLFQLVLWLLHHLRLSSLTLLTQQMRLLWTLSSESDNTCFPPSSNHANAASAKKPHKPKKTKKSSNQHGGKDVDLDRLSDSFQLPVKRSHKCAKARSGNVSVGCYGNLTYPFSVFLHFQHFRFIQGFIILFMHQQAVVMEIITIMLIQLDMSELQSYFMMKKVMIFKKKKKKKDRPHPTTVSSDSSN